MDHRLAITEDDGVEEVSDRLDVERARTAGDNQWITAVALRGSQRNAAEIQHGKQVGVGEFILQRETHDVELVQGGEGLQRGERQVRAPQLGLHVEPGGVDALRKDVRAAVQKI